MRLRRYDGSASSSGAASGMGADVACTGGPRPGTTKLVIHEGGGSGWVRGALTSRGGSSVCGRVCQAEDVGASTYDQADDKCAGSVAAPRRGAEGATGTGLLARSSRNGGACTRAMCAGAEGAGGAEDAEGAEGAEDAGAGLAAASAAGAARPPCTVTRAVCALAVCIAWNSSASISPNVFWGASCGWGGNGAGADVGVRTDWRLRLPLRSHCDPRVRRLPSTLLSFADESEPLGTRSPRADKGCERFWKSGLQLPRGLSACNEPDGRRGEPNGCLNRLRSERLLRRLWSSGVLARCSASLDTRLCGTRGDGIMGVLDRGATSGEPNDGDRSVLTTRCDVKRVAGASTRAGSGVASHRPTTGCGAAA